jgi:hypothetical protein
MVTSTTNPLILFDTAPAAPTPNDVADDHSLLKIDQELDFLMERIEDEIEESGEASKDSMDRLQLFCQAMNVKVDRIGRYLAVMEVRAEHCRKEAPRYAARAKRTQSKIDRTKALFLYYLESHNLKQLETEDTTLRRQKNSQDSVLVTNPDAIPADLKRYELKFAGDIWMKVFLALPEELAAALQAAISSAEPMNQAIKQCFASGRTIDGVVVKRLYHLRTA